MGFSPLEPTWLRSKMRVKTKRFEVASAAQADSVRRDEEGRCAPAATRLHLLYGLMAGRGFLHVHQFPFITAGVKNNVSLQQKSHPGVQRKSSKEFRNNRSYFARPFPSEGPGIPRKAGAFTNFHLCPNGRICLCSHLLFGFFFALSLHYLPPVLPPFLSSSWSRGTTDWLLIYKCLCFLKSGTKGGWPVTPGSPEPAQVHCEALGTGLLVGDPGPLTHTHIPGPCHSCAHRCMSPHSSHCFSGDNGGTPPPTPTHTNPPFFSASFQTSL